MTDLKMTLQYNENRWKVKRMNANARVESIAWTIRSIAIDNENDWISILRLSIYCYLCEIKPTNLNVSM